MKEKKRISVCEWLLADADRESAKEKIVGERERKKKYCCRRERKSCGERKDACSDSREIKKVREKDRERSSRNKPASFKC